MSSWTASPDQFLQNAPPPAAPKWSVSPDDFLKAPDTQQPQQKSAVPQILAEEPPNANTRVVEGKPVNVVGVGGKYTPPPVDDRSDVRKFLETPLISSKDIDEALPFLVGPFALHKGILKGAAGMTSPESAAIIAGTGGLGMAAEATTAGVAQAARVAQAGLSAYFATQAGRAVLPAAVPCCRSLPAART